VCSGHHAIADPSRSDVGVEMFHSPGVYRRGTSRDNLVEAAKVVERVLHHYSTRPDSTLGVVTFSVAQADAIQAALDRALIERPDLERYFDGDRLHGFFIKSLESVQGDERDVIIFSIGYGPDENGKITSNFGALNKPKGWRRLNVAITRARQRIEIVPPSARATFPPRTTKASATSPHTSTSPSAAWKPLPLTSARADVAPTARSRTP
jgi:hypothetical protein